MDIEPQTTEQEAEELLPLPEWLAGLNSELGSQAAGSAEQAFGMGCATSLVPGVIVLGLAFLLGIRHWVSLSLVSLVIVLLATAWAIFVAYQAHGFCHAPGLERNCSPGLRTGSGIASGLLQRG
jgi:hypothetical protein